MTDLTPAELNYKDFFRNHPLFLEYRFVDQNGRPVCYDSYDGRCCGWIDDKHVHPVLYNAVYQNSRVHWHFADAKLRVMNADDLVLTMASVPQLEQGWYRKSGIFAWATKFHQCLHDYERQNLVDGYVLDSAKLGKE